MKTKVKLILNIGGTEIKLSTKGAKELHEILDGMYGEKVVRHEYWNQPNRIWPYQQWTTTNAIDSQMAADTTSTDTVYLSLANEISQGANGVQQ